MPAGSATSLATLADILVRVATAPAGHRRSLGAAATGAPADDGRFAPVFALVRDRLPAAIPQRQAAALVHLSPAAFCRAFRAATGATFSAHVLGRRLTLAAEALAAGNRTVARIAADCGFAGSAHFNRRFRQRFGCTPSAYRRLVRGG
jgi:transcriptional regulator GlxA family with amidase domain